MLTNELFLGKSLHNVCKGINFATYKFTTQQNYNKLFKLTTMTQQEFTSRTLVEVTTDEFEAINVVYMNSDLDKDEFCKLWRKMNASRVKQAKEQQAKISERLANQDKLFNLHWKLQQIAETGEYGYNDLTITYLSDKEEELLNYFGIVPVEDAREDMKIRHFQTLGETLYDIHRYFHDLIK